MAAVTARYHRVVAGVATVFALVLATACSSGLVRPSASPGASADDAERERCIREGGNWRSGLGVWGGGMCETAKGGGGAASQPAVVRSFSSSSAHRA